ncbi:MAG: chloride channel protein [Clostridia bacterium]|nr:chloride channel protein [Clostridia bacterium]
MKRKKKHLKNTLLPCLAFASAIGVLTGGAIFIFRIAATAVIALSERIFASARADARYLWILLPSAAVLGLICSLILKLWRDCRGGGIPTAVASIRGLVPLKWVQGIFALFVTSLITFLGGVPLGNEGPSVLMGASIGKGTASAGGKKHRAWERYCMTGGASAGFALATGAPISGVIFALEEAHRRFSVSLLVFSSISVCVGTLTQEALCHAFGVHLHSFRFASVPALPLKFLYLSLIIGIVCGFCAVLFTKLYGFFKSIQKKSPIRIRFIPKITAIFFVTALLGFASADFVGSGHGLIEKLLMGGGVWYMLLLALIVRAVLMIAANGEGITGGVFVPTLAFGALIAALFYRAADAISLAPAGYESLFIAIGMTAFLAAASRIPMTALVFSIEVLAGVQNTLAIGIAVTAAFMVVEFSGKVSFADTIIEAKAHATHEGRVPLIINAFVTVQPDSFADGKELRDLLLPPTCAVLSIDMKDPAASEILAGDVLHLHYNTYHAKETLASLEAIFGPQPQNERDRIHFGSESHVVPAD